MPKQPAMTQQKQPIPEDKGGGQNIQELYDIFVSQGIIILSKLDLNYGNDPQKIAETLVQVINKLESSGKQNGIVFPKEVLFNGAKELLIKALELAGVEPTEQDVKKIVGHMFGMYFDNAVKSGAMTPQEVADLAKEAKQMMGGQAPAMPQQGQGPQGQGLLARGGANGLG